MAKRKTKKVKKEVKVETPVVEKPAVETPLKDPNELLESFLRENNVELDFDVLDGSIPTKKGIIKLEKPTLVVKAQYVTSKR